MHSRKTTRRSGQFFFAGRCCLIMAAILMVMAGNLQAEETAEEKNATPTDGEYKEENMSWQKSLAEKATSSLKDMAEFAHVRWRQFSDRMGFHTPRHIAAYRGYATFDTVHVKGRLLANKPYGGPKDDDNWWDNLKATYGRWESDEIPGAAVRLRYVDQTRDVTTDEEGFYSATFDLDRKFPKSESVAVMHELEDRVLLDKHSISVVDRQAEFLLISDVDDTVIHTGITDLLVSAQLTFLNNAKTRKPLPGVGSLYRSLAYGRQKQPVNPVIYLSNSAWNMYDLLRDFINLNDLPAGPLMLRDIGLSSDSSSHKMDTLVELLRQYEQLPVVLVGDSGQHDALYYSKIAQRYPERVKAIYIRDIDPEEESEYDANVDDIIARAEEVGVPFLRVQNSEQIAEHAVKIGLLPEESIADISSDTKKDLARETAAEKAVLPDKDK